MKYLKSIYLLLSCTLVWGACTDDEPDYGTSGIAINAPTTVEVSSSVVTLSSTIRVRNDVRYTSTG
ncbi:MAG TPA: arabinan endo-1,5-alpha-L-arabinosidase, partial [Bacteroides reticulotermitis]|nr:arabinan endo-1,5-alpha-L-arabinosidase [Bacteroides reticulotermitis]